MEFDLPIIAPSILAADYTILGEQIKESERGGAAWIHCDIMDGHFVPNISYGPDIVKAARRSAPDLLLDVHLMIQHPDQYIESFADAGADLISVHLEACPHLHRTLQLIRANGCMKGVAINPATPVSLLEPVLDMVDLIVIMSVNPGFGGQSFIESSIGKIDSLKHLRESTNVDFLIEVDGGVGLRNCEKLTRAGVDVLVAGSSVFKQDDIRSSVMKLKEQANLGRKDIV